MENDKIMCREKHWNIRIGTLVDASVGPDQTASYIRQVLPHGFESFQLSFWRTLGDTDLHELADKVNAALEGSGAVISSIGVFGNPMETDELDLETLKGYEAVIENAHLFGCDILAGFAGRLRGRAIHECVDRFKEIWGPLALCAKEKGVRIAFENCAMGGTWVDGDWNIAHNPASWEMMFDAIPLDNLGLCWEPCHQMVSLIDPMPQLREWVSRIFHVHGKDANVHWDVVRKYGVHSCTHGDVALPGRVLNIPPFSCDRTPGFGDSNWADIISELRRGGFTGSIDIEGWHDPVYKGDLEMTGQVRALNYLKDCRGGDFVDCPE
jgi:sugar phosphate isomerase/epimerase